VNLAGNSVTFHLTAKGQSEFGRLVAKKGSFQALVLSSDVLGAWVLFPGLSEIPEGKTPVMLVKWEHVSWAVFEHQPTAPVAKGRMGFVQHERGN
jgi:hypothetical protein